MMWMAEYFLPLRVSPICAMASWFGSRMAVSMPFLMPEIRVWPSGMSDAMKAISLIVCSIGRLLLYLKQLSAQQFYLDAIAITICIYMISDSIYDSGVAESMNNS